MVKNDIIDSEVCLNFFMFNFSFIFMIPFSKLYFWLLIDFTNDKMYDERKFPRF